MRHSLFLVLLIVSATSAMAQADQNIWSVTGRIAYITETTYPDSNKITSVTLANQDSETDGIFTRYIEAACSSWISCPTTLLGSCTKQTSTAIIDSLEGATTFKVTSCVNQHYADCWTFSGFMTPRLWATTRTQSYGCNF